MPAGERHPGKLMAGRARESLEPRSKIGHRHPAENMLNHPEAEPEILDKKTVRKYQGPGN